MGKQNIHHVAEKAAAKPSFLPPSSVATFLPSTSPLPWSRDRLMTIANLSKEHCLGFCELLFSELRAFFSYFVLTLGLLYLP